MFWKENIDFLGNYDMFEMKRWPTKLTAKTTTNKNVESRKLDFDMSALNI